MHIILYRKEYNYTRGLSYYNYQFYNMLDYLRGKNKGDKIFKE